MSLGEGFTFGNNGLVSCKLNISEYKAPFRLFSLLLYEARMQIRRCKVDSCSTLEVLLLYFQTGSFVCLNNLE